MGHCHVNYFVTFIPRLLTLLLRTHATDDVTVGVMYYICMYVNHIFTRSTSAYIDRDIELSHLYFL